MIAIGNGTTFLDISPRHGARVTGFYSLRGPDVLHWLHPLPPAAFDCLRAPKAGLFLLAPFSNRIRDARFRFRGEDIVLEPHPDAAPNAMHGGAAFGAWDVAEHAPDRVRLTRDHAGGGWPWRTELTFEARFEDATLHLALTARNADRRAAPIGLGFHPFFPRTADAEITLCGTRVWEIGPDYRPSAARPAEAVRLPPRIKERPVALFHEGVHEARLRYPGWGAELRMEASESLPYWLVFAPKDLPYFCAEPVSHLTGAFQQDEATAAAQGLVVLRPGERLTASLALTPRLQG